MKDALLELHLHNLQLCDGLRCFLHQPLHPPTMALVGEDCLLLFSHEKAHRCLTSILIVLLSPVHTNTSPFLTYCKLEPSFYTAMSSSVFRTLAPAFALTFALSTLQVFAHNSSTCNNLTQIYTVSEEKEKNWVDNVHSISTDSPITRQIRKNKTLQELVNPAFDVFERIASVIDDRRKDNHTDACNLPTNLGWRKRAIKTTRNFQIGFMDETCFTSLNIRDAVESKELPYSDLSTARTIMHEAHTALYKASFDAVGILARDNKNWSDRNAPYRLADIPQRRSEQTCSIEALSGYRVQGTWYLRSIVTNKPVSQVMPQKFRQFVIEWVPSEGNEALRMIHFNFSREGEECLVNSSTIFNQWAGRGQKSAEGYDFESRVTAISAAYRQNLISVDIASDSVTVSNIAILALPMTMNIIPVAFVAELTFLGMFAYVVVTDIFSTVPFFVKGIELIQSSNPREEVVVAFHGGNKTLGSMELFSAVCRGKETFRVTGIVFVVFATFAMFFGVAFEIWAYRLMRHRLATAGPGVKVRGPFTAGVDEAALLHTYENGLEDKSSDYTVGGFEVEGKSSSRRSDTEERRESFLGAAGSPTGEANETENRTRRRLSALIGRGGGVSN